MNGNEHWIKVHIFLVKSREALSLFAIQESTQTQTVFNYQAHTVDFETRHGIFNSKLAKKSSRLFAIGTASLDDHRKCLSFGTLTQA